MKYKILAAQTSAHLEKLVQEHIEKGWTPVGGLATTPMPGFYQAMILEDKGNNLQ